MKASSGAGLKLLGLALAFFGPVLIAMILYWNPQLLEYGNTNHGELISPVKTLAPLEAVSEAREKLPTDLLFGKWTLLYWSDAGCNLSCEASLFKTKQVSLATGKDMGRVQTVYLSTSEPAGVPTDRHPQLLVAYFPEEENGAFARQIGAYPKNSIYIVDPLGNLMMRYTDDATSKGILRDLKRLLRISGIG